MFQNMSKHNIPKQITTFTIQNRWKNVYLEEKDGQLIYTNNTKPQRWVMKSNGKGDKEFSRFNTNNYIHIEHEKKWGESSKRHPSWARLIFYLFFSFSFFSFLFIFSLYLPFQILLTTKNPSSKWILQNTTDGFVRIQSAWKTNNYLHIENQTGFIEQGTIQDSWYSAQWLLIPHLSLPQKLPLPFQSLLPQQATLSGNATLSPSPTSSSFSFSGLPSEALTRQFITLKNGGDRVSWTLPSRTNSVIVRFSIPDSKDGNGLSAPLEVLGNGKLCSVLMLSSKWSWNYGKYPWTNNPSDGNPRKFWDEVQTLIYPLEAGDTIILQKPHGVPFSIHINFVDIEMVAAPLKKPPGSICLLECGAVRDGKTNDTKALEKAISLAGDGGVVWAPPGCYYIDKVLVSNVTIKGAGMWHSRFVGPLSQFYCKGGNLHFSDFAIFGETRHRIDTNGVDNAINGLPGEGSTMKRIWVEHKKCAFWVSSEEALPTEQLVISQCRFRNLMADAINFFRGTCNSLVDNTHIRYAGDDALATWNPKSSPRLSHGNVFCNNTIALSWLASGISIYGGGYHSVVNNDLCDVGTYSGSGIYITNNFRPKPLEGAIKVLGNHLVRCGSPRSDPGGPTGALRVLAWDTDITTATIRFEDNTIIAPIESGISFGGDGLCHGKKYSMCSIHFQNIKIVDAKVGIDIRKQAVGSADFTKVQVSKCGEGVRKVGGNNFKLLKFGVDNCGW